MQMNEVNNLNEDDKIHGQKCKKRDQDARQAALQRWNILREVILSGRGGGGDDSVSVRRFKSYGLLSTNKVTVDADSPDTARNWFIYTCPSQPDFSMQIRHLSDHVTPEALRGFNNTGNVCVWPSEEVMTYYCLKHPDVFRNKCVIELGGGMTCLTGVSLGLQSAASYIELTDGNEDSVSNLQVIVERNLPKAKAELSSKLLRWGSGPLDADLAGKFDIVLCADCLFFKEGRQDLITTIHDLLKPDGEAWLFAPKRGETFDEFVVQARSQFLVTVQQIYDDQIWKLHTQMESLGQDHYDADIHYPWFIHLTPLPGPSREDSSER
ncbi:calmodulin-lysine N-methyltransferase-like [Mya arenaria]|uniref:calmodulin-lysine N-methyltransferase-like n=1 Tax=Mya arenaria TaxID=6604 RepID=UPI0022E0BC09|nr:calmodulin-lysine N-methyltransferase-like [Mya arenaria]